MKYYVGCIIQARLTSSRFPNKILEEIDGIPVLEHVVKRVARAETVDKTVLAVPHSPSACLNEDIFIGSEHDVLDRYYQCAKYYGFNVIVRITADCPLVPPFEIDRVVKEFIKTRADYATNRPATPDGWDVEVFSFQALQKAWEKAKKKEEREHVTPFIKKKKCFRHLILDAPKLSVDTQEDLTQIRRFYEYEMGR